MTLIRAYLIATLALLVFATIYRIRREPQHRGWYLRFAATCGVVIDAVTWLVNDMSL
jgi:hypothetical protein